MAATLGNGNITFGDSTTQSTAALPLTGGTLTGALSGTSISTTGNVTIGGALAANGGVTLGDAAADTLTITSNTATVNNTLTLAYDAATTNTVVDVLTLRRTSSGTPANGIGAGLAFQVETTASNNEIGATIDAVVTDVTATSEDFDLVFSTMAAGAAVAERMRLNSSGNLALGVTPSAWYSSARAIQVGATGGIFGRTTDELVGVLSNAYNSASNFGTYAYITTGNKASLYLQNQGAHAWYTAPSGTAGNAISFTQAMTLDTNYNLTLNAGGGYQTTRGGIYPEGAGQLFYSNGYCRFSNNSSETMRIDSSGNVGIGTSSPATRLHISQAGECVLRISNTSASTNVSFGVDASGGYMLTASSLPLMFYTSGTYRMQLDASGNLLLGTSSIGSTGTYRGITFGGGATQSLGAGLDYAGAVYRYDAVNENGFAFWNTRGGASPVGGPVMIFYVGSGMTKVGSITTSSTTTSFNTSSDYRLKENIQPMQNALGVVAQLNPVTYNWKSDGSDGQGFIAHELQAVVPDCVTGEKDAVDKDGKPVYQGVDTSFLVATLTKAIQEQQEQINQLKAEVAALKGN